ncbi:MAG: hypothetical protein SFT91_05160 [Rickettsiaceae bacterium]|nr:hypothetical protein [Rickettsiaceae bacterium]
MNTHPALKLHMYKIMHALHYADKLSGDRIFPSYTDEVISQITAIPYDGKFMEEEFAHLRNSLMVDPLDLSIRNIAPEINHARYQNLGGVGRIVVRMFGISGSGDAGCKILSFLDQASYENTLKALIIIRNEMEVDEESGNSWDDNIPPLSTTPMDLDLLGKEDREIA